MQKRPALIQQLSLYRARILVCGLHAYAGLGSGKFEMGLCKQKLVHGQVNLAEKGELCLLLSCLDVHGCEVFIFFSSC